MIIRKAELRDISRIDETYTELLLWEQVHGSTSNWKLGIYPTKEYAREKTMAEEMYILEENGMVCASMVLNHDQAKEYNAIEWAYPAEEDQVLVIHTLCVPPDCAGHGYATQMLQFAKRYACEQNYKVIRIDTFSGNEPAKRLYQKNGFRLAGSCRCLHQGVIEEELIYLEYKLEQNRF